jgi:hypothetical protein
MLETGIYPLGKSNSLRAQDIEVFAADVVAFPNAIQQAHYELVATDSKNSASYSTAPLAPDMIAFGEASSVANGLVVAPDGPWPPTLGGARLDITDSNGQTRPALLYFVTGTQLSYLIPAATALGHASLRLTTSTGTTIADGFQVQRVSPSLFTANASGSGVAAGFWIRVAGNGAQTQGYLFDPSQAAGSRNPVAIDLEHQPTESICRSTVQAFAAQPYRQQLWAASMCPCWASTRLAPTRVRISSTSDRCHAR